MTDRPTTEAMEKARLGICLICSNLFLLDGHAYDCPLSRGPGVTEPLTARQVECPDCGAPMWAGRRCPWDNGQGCIARTLSGRVRSPSPVAAAPVRRPAVRPSDETRATCRPGRHPRPSRGQRCRLCVRDGLRKLQGPRPPAVCVNCGTEFEARYPRRRKYCSSRCRGQYSRRASVQAR